MTLSSQTTAPPGWLRTLGWLNILFGLLVLPANAAVVGLGIGKFQEMGISQSAATLWLAVGVYLATGLVLVVAGIGLLQPAVWGRWLSLLGVALVFAAILGAGVCVNVAFESARHEYDGRLTEVTLHGGIPALWPGYAALLLVLLNLPSVRHWASGTGETKGLRVSKLAIVTLVLALTPAGGVTQAAAILFGLVALVWISRSGGTLAGAGLAVAGMLLSVLIIAGCVGWLVLSNWATGTAFSSMFLTPLAGLIMLPVAPFLVGKGRTAGGSASR